MVERRVKFVLASSLILLLVAAFGFGFVLGNPGASTSYVEAGVYPSAFKYTFWVEGSTYFAKDAFGLIPSWGESSNATYVFQTAISATTSSGGTIYITNGHYDFTGSYAGEYILLLSPNVAFEGEDMFFTTLHGDPASGSNLDLIRATENNTVRNLHLLGDNIYGLNGFDPANTANVGSGIGSHDYANPRNYVFQNILAERFRYQGIGLTGSEPALGEAEGGVLIGNIVARGNGDCGVFIGFGLSKFLVSDVLVEDNSVGISIDDGSHDGVIQNVYAWNNDNSYPTPYDRALFINSWEPATPDLQFASANVTVSNFISSGALETCNGGFSVTNAQFDHISMQWATDNLSVEDISLSNIFINTTKADTISIDLSSPIPYRNILMNNIDIYNYEWIGIAIRSDEGTENIFLSNLNIKAQEQAFYFENITTGGVTSAYLETISGAHDVCNIIDSVNMTMFNIHVEGGTGHFSEIGSCDYNIFLAIFADDIITVGANTHVAESWDNGVWIP